MPTPQEFIERWPLYTRADLIDFEPPTSISRHCESPSCKKETTWYRSNDNSFQSESTPRISIGFTSYTCALCRNQSFVVLYRKLDWKPRVVGSTRDISSYHAVQKVGQVPPPSIDVPSDIGARLGAATKYYRNALTCRAFNLGIAAVAYMRRVVEEETDALIDVVVELAMTYNVDEKTLEALRKAKTEVRYEDKLHVASEVIPDTMKPAGVNPLGQLYRHLSVGVHGKTDDECILIFDDLKADFEFVFRNLHIQAKERSEFAQRVQNRAGKKL